MSFKKLFWPHGFFLFVLAFLYLPLFLLVAFSFNNSEHIAIWEGFSLRWYEKVLGDRSFWDSGFLTISLAVATTLSSSVLGTMAAMGLRGVCSRSQSWINGIFLIPLVLPEVILAVLLLKLFGGLGISLSFLTMWLGHTIFSVSYVFLVVKSRLHGMGQILEEAAMDLGARGTEVFWLATFPQIRPALISSALLVFTLSVDDYLITSFISGAGNTTWPLHIYSLIRKKMTPEINVICTLLLIMTTALICLAYFMQKRFTANSRDR